MNLRVLTKTPISRDEFARAIQEADPSLSKPSAGILYGQYALETGQGSACWNWNIGNVKVKRSQAEAGRPFVMLPNTWEIENGVRKVYQPPHEQTWFRAYDTLAEAMVEHLAFLRRRYAAAWAYVLAGDPRAFVAALKRGQYFSGDEAKYASSVEWFLSAWMRLAPWAEGEVPEPVEPMGGIIHGSHVVDWALEQREADMLDALADVGSFGRYDDEEVA